MCSTYNRCFDTFSRCLFSYSTATMLSYCWVSSILLCTRVVQHQSCIAAGVRTQAFSFCSYCCVLRHLSVAVLFVRVVLLYHYNCRYCTRAVSARSCCCMLLCLLRVPPMYDHVSIVSSLRHASLCHPVGTTPLLERERCM